MSSHSLVLGLISAALQNFITICGWYLHKIAWCLQNTSSASVFFFNHFSSVQVNLLVWADLSCQDPRTVRRTFNKTYISKKNNNNIKKKKKTKKRQPYEQQVPLRLGSHFGTQSVFFFPRRLYVQCLFVLKMGFPEFYEGCCPDRTVIYDITVCSEANICISICSNAEIICIYF